MNSMAFGYGVLLGILDPLLSIFLRSFVQPCLTSVLHSLLSYLSFLKRREVITSSFVLLLLELLLLKNLLSCNPPRIILPLTLHEHVDDIIVGHLIILDHLGYSQD
jgi:hypothetical protein